MCVQSPEPVHPLLHTSPSLKGIQFAEDTEYESSYRDEVDRQIDVVVSSKQTFIKHH